VRVVVAFADDASFRSFPCVVFVVNDLVIAWKRADDEKAYVCRRPRCKTQRVDMVNVGKRATMSADLIHS
jgi:hypothetical protein